jgi:transcriptional regulator with XRE-family HTH domain
MSLSIDYEQASIEAIQANLGQRLVQLRLARNVNQQQLAREAGVSRRTITRLENGESVSLDTLLRVMRALDVIDRLGALLPDPAVRPIDRVRLKDKERRRARAKPTTHTEPWTWADEDDAKP